MEDYYDTPSDEVFEAIRQAAIEIWSTYSDEFGYRTDKVSRIVELDNLCDNAMYMVSMFDHLNQGKLLALLEGEARKYVSERLFWQMNQLNKELSEDASELDIEELS